MCVSSSLRVCICVCVRCLDWETYVHGCVVEEEDMNVSERCSEEVGDRLSVRDVFLVRRELQLAAAVGGDRAAESTPLSDKDLLASTSFTADKQLARACAFRIRREQRQASLARHVDSLDLQPL